MTRDEAIEIFYHATPHPASLADSAWIDRFVALGMLKLDEPPQKYSARTLAAVKECRSFYVESAEFLDALAARGFSFIEK